MNKRLLILVFAFISCTHSKKQIPEKIDFPITVNLNLSEAIEDSMNLSEIAYKVEYIPLQTTDSSLMAYFWNFAITKDYFFIVNGLSVLTFDKYGKYVNSLFNKTEIKSSSKYLKNMTPIFSKITEFSNPIIMKVSLK